MTERRLIHIIDDEEGVRRSTGFMLKTSGYVVQSWASGPAFLKDVRGLDPGCILLDIRMPEMDGLEVQQALNARGVTMPVVILTGHGDVPIAVKAMRAGAIDFLEKPFEEERLLAAIDMAFACQAQRGAEVSPGAEARARLGTLSTREREVLDGLARGLPNKAIANDLGISPRTVEVHRSNLMAKLGARNFAEALRFAFAAELADD
jgi:two-component system, LuxR family, response regulator FixJ